MKRNILILVVVFIAVVVCISCGESSMDEAKAREYFWANAGTRVVGTYEVSEWGEYNDSLYCVILEREIPEYGNVLLLEKSTVEIKEAPTEVEELDIVEDYLAPENGEDITVSTLYDENDESLVSQDYLPGYGWIHYILYEETD